MALRIARPWCGWTSRPRWPRCVACRHPSGCRNWPTLAGTDADRLFFEIMTDHHLGGVHMADHAAANGARQEIIDFAESVSRNQRIEVVEYARAMERLGLA